MVAEGSGYVFYWFPFVAFTCTIICAILVPLPLPHGNGARSVSTPVSSLRMGVSDGDTLQSHQQFTFSLTSISAEQGSLGAARVQCRFLPLPSLPRVYSLCGKKKGSKGGRRKERRNFKSIASLPRLHSVVCLIANYGCIEFQASVNKWKKHLGGKGHVWACRHSIKYLPISTSFPPHRGWSNKNS